MCRGCRRRGSMSRGSGCRGRGASAPPSGRRRRRRVSAHRISGAPARRQRWLRRGCRSRRARRPSRRRRGRLGYRRRCGSWGAARWLPCSWGTPARKGRGQASPPVMPPWLRCRTAASPGDGTSRRGNSSGGLDGGLDPERLHCCRGPLGRWGTLVAFIYVTYYSSSVPHSCLKIIFD